MGKSKKSKPQKTVKLNAVNPFSKKKIKVGRQLKRSNETKLTIKTKKIILGPQFLRAPDTEVEKGASKDEMELMTELLNGLLSSRADNRVSALKELCSRIDQYILERKRDQGESIGPACSNQLSYDRNGLPRCHLAFPLGHLPSLFLRFLRESGRTGSNLRSTTINTIKRCQSIYITEETSCPQQSLVWRAVYEQLCRDSILVLFTFVNDAVQWEAANFLGHIAKHLPSAFQISSPDSTEHSIQVAAAQRKCILSEMFSQIIRLFLPPPQMAMGFTHEKRILVVRTLSSFVSAILGDNELSEDTIKQMADSSTRAYLNKDIITASFSLLKIIVRDILPDDVRDSTIPREGLEQLLGSISVRQKTILHPRKAETFGRDLLFLIYYRKFLEGIPLKKTQSDRSIEFLARHFFSEEKVSNKSGKDMNAIFSTKVAKHKLWKAEKKKAKRKLRHSD